MPFGYPLISWVELNQLIGGFGGVTKIHRERVCDLPCRTHVVIFLQVLQQSDWQPVDSLQVVMVRYFHGIVIPGLHFFLSNENVGTCVHEIVSASKDRYEICI